MRIGIVDLDTSHPEGFVPILREMGHPVAGVWDGGSVHPPQYARAFAKTHNIPRVYDTLEQMAEDVDCAMVLSCDWDTHLAKAKPFVDAGKAVLMDKPLAGNLKDLQTLCDWVDHGARITGGSSLRYCDEIRDWLALPIEQRGTPDTVLCGCAVDDFNYGIHAYAMLCAILGTQVVSVRHLGQGQLRRIQVDFAEGQMGLLVVGTAQAWQPFYASITTGLTNTVFQVDNTKIYRGLLEATLPYLTGESDEPAIAMRALVVTEKIALAARQSWLQQGEPVRIDALDPEDTGYEGASFAALYQRQKYPTPLSKAL